MSLTTLTYIAADLIALAVLVGALYAPRHSRKDLMAAYIGVNVGVLAVTLLLSTASVAAGLGLGLFGVLSIIRLRSTELAQHEVAYFFAALALGLLGGIQTAPIGMVAALMGTVVAALWIGDHPALMRRNRHQVIVLDHAITNETALIAHLERTLGGQVRSVEVQRLDLVDDTTTVDVPRHAAGHRADRRRRKRGTDRPVLERHAPERRAGRLPPRARRGPAPHRGAGRPVRHSLRRAAGGLARGRGLALSATPDEADRTDQDRQGPR